MSAKARELASTELASTLVKEISNVQQVGISSTKKNANQEIIPPVATSTPEKQSNETLPGRLIMDNYNSM